MNKRIYAAIIAMILAATFAFAGTSFGENIKQRMASRIPAIGDLKAKGTIGENNQGYLEFRTESREGQDIVTGENTDRKAVYEHIAQQQGITADFVGQRRAAQIAEIADPGIWLQDPSGKWYKK
ncbi:MAG: YdbL family protein [Desulfatibacillum sp.]|nr:YdbL family protein [Desulfatibacillum sp.]